MPTHTPTLAPFCGNEVTDQQLELIQRIAHRYRNLSRTELAATVCELLGWVRQNGKPKTVESLSYLDKLAQQQRITLPPRQQRRAKRTAVAIPVGEPMDQSPIQGKLRQLQPIRLTRVSTPGQRDQWRSLVEQHHYLGHKIPFGAHLRYLIQSEQNILGCLQFSSPAWRLQSRDRWIGWDEAQRKTHLQHVLCNSRFLILPWVQVRNLASHVLAKSAQQIVTDWQAHYHVTPWLLESMVDARRFSGTCYRAANWIHAGETGGRGRNDRHHQRHGASPKQVWLYALHPQGRARLCREV
jgi:hypothetical protein